MLMKKFFFSLILCLLAMAQIHAQRTVSGKVTDDEGEGLPGVNVVIKGTTTGVTTDIDGNYRLQVNDADVLTFSYVGFESQEIAVGTRTTIDVTLGGITELQEVVVTGYGVQDKRDLSGSVASLKKEQIENVPSLSFDRVLQGKTAGVQVTGASGIPGGAVNVRIRGDGSINAGSQPLYIVDGVMISGGTNDAQLIASTNALAALNPNDIESIDVLKDAAASAIYGAQAANGVVIITTKRGKEGKAQFEFNISAGVMEDLKRFDVMTGSEWIEFHQQAYINTFGAGSPQLAAFQAQWGEASNAINTDWQDLAFRTGSFKNYELSARGGNETTNYFVSGSYNKTDAHVIGTDFERFTLRTNIETKLTDKIKAGTNISLSNVVQNQASEGGFFVSPVFSGAAGVPAESPFNDDGTYNDNLVSANGANFVRWTDLSKNNGVTNTVIARLYLEYEPIENLIFRSSGSVENRAAREIDYWHPDTNDGASFGGLNQSTHVTDQSLQTDHTVSYNRDIDKHSISGLVGVNYRYDRQTLLYAAGSGFSNGLLSTIGNAATPLGVNGTDTEWKLAGVFTRLGYIYDDKYIASFTLRRDGSSRFGGANQFGVFPAASVAWRVSSESFMDNISIVNDLKVRASYGETGNHLIGNFDALGLVGAGGSYQGGSSLIPSNIANPLLQWETNVFTNFGLDFGILDGRFRGSIDYYIRDTNDLLLNSPIPRTNGFNTITSNVGRIRNSGIEIELNSTNLSTGGFTWTTNFNIAFQDSEVLELADSDTLVIANSGQTYIVGQEMNAFYLQRWAGVNPADGRPMWYDENGEITYQNASGNTRQVVGSALPDYFGGITNSFSYKGLELSVLFQFQVGNLIRNTQRAYMLDAGNSGGSRGLLRDNFNSWQQPGDLVPNVVPLVGAQSYPNGAGDANGTNNTRFLEKGDYLRLKEVIIGYTLPSSIVSKTGLNRVRLYATGVNLWTMTEFTGYDPEVTGTGFGIVPQARTYTFGAQIGF